MKRTFFFALPSMAALLLAAAPAFAHEQQMFRVGDRQYQFVVGSLSEPLYLDEKSGVDLRVYRVDDHPSGAKAAASDDGDDDAPAGTPVVGLEKTLKVELVAGDKKKPLELSPADAPGAYSATFFPTVATTITYRVYGDLEGTPVDLAFNCNPAGHAMAEEEKTEVAVSDKVTRTLKTGAFGCPVSRADVEFPESNPSLRELSKPAPAPAAAAAPSGILPTVLAAAALALSLAALASARKK